MHDLSLIPLSSGTELVRRVLSEMKDRDCVEVTLEAEVTNKAALRLYENLGFIRDKRLRRYYLNGNDAYRLKLLFPTNMEILGKAGQREGSLHGDDVAAAIQLKELSLASDRTEL